MNTTFIRRIAPAWMLLAISSGAVAQSAQPSAPSSMAQCVVCHSAKKGDPHLVGPNLFGVLGRPVAGEKDYVYSKALKALQQKKWSKEELDLWLKAPMAYAPGSKMAYAGVSDPVERKALIDYLATLR